MQCNTPFRVHGQASGVPAPPALLLWDGLVGTRGGWLLWRGIRGGWSCSWGGRGAGVTERAGILRKPYTSHKPYNVAPAPVF